MIMVQDTQSARFPGMPQSAVATGLVDDVLSPDQMPAALLTYVRGPYLTRSATAPVTFTISPAVLQEMLSLLHSHTGHSFATSKISTIRRRIARRLTLHQMTQPDHDLRYVREHPEELDTLVQERQHCRGERGGGTALWLDARGVARAVDTHAGARRVPGPG